MFTFLFFCHNVAISQFVEMATVADSCKQDLEADATTKSATGQKTTEPDRLCEQVTALEPCSERMPAVSNAYIEGNEAAPHAGRIPTCGRRGIVVFGSILLLVMLGMVVFVVIRILNQV